MSAWAGKVAALMLMLALAFAPLIQGLTHPATMSLAPMSDSSFEHGAVNDHFHPHTTAFAHSHDGQSIADHDHVPSVILGNVKAVPIWPRVKPTFAYNHNTAFGVTNALRRPPRFG